MSSNLLYIPTRTTTAVDLVPGLKKSIEDVYKRSGEKYHADLIQLQLLRREVENSKQTSGATEPHITYFDQISLISSKFPSEVGVDFVWYNTLGYASKVAVTSNNIQFERINVLYDIAAIYSYLAFTADVKTGAGLKDAFKYFQISAGSLRLLIDKVMPEFHDPIPIGLELVTLEALYYLVLAQAQESFWHKAVLEGLRNSTIAKLASQVSYLYDKALSYTNRTPSLRSEWIHHITCKHFHFQAATQYRLALDCLDKGKHGEEVARLKQCIDYCNASLAVSKYVVEAVVSDVTGLFEAAKSALKISEKDNDYIYLQPVPNSLPSFSHGEVIAQPQILPDLINYEEHLKKVGQTALLSDLIPYSIYEASNIYTHNIQDYVFKNIIKPTESITQSWHQKLTDYQLPGCLSALEEPKGVPSDLITKSDQLQSQNGIYIIKRGMEDVLVLSTRCQVLLDTSKDLLNKEAEEDSMMRKKFGNDWNVAPSSESAAGLNEKVETMSGYLASALSSDKLVRTKYDQIEHLLQVLEKGQYSMQQFIPNTSQVNLSELLKRCLSNIRGILVKANDQIDERTRYLMSLKFQVENIDLYNEFVSFYKCYIEAVSGNSGSQKVETSQFEPLYHKLTEQYNKDLHWLQGQKEDHELLTASLKNEMTKFNELSKIEASILERQTAIQCLEVAFFKYGEIKDNLEEGVTFYNVFLQQLNGFVGQCKEYIHSRRTAAAALEDKLLRASNMSSSISKNEDSSNSEPLVAPKARYPGGWSS